MLETKKYLTDVKMENHSAVGIVGEQAKITHTGMHPCKYVGKVYCSKDVKVNLMSVPVMMDNGCTIDGAKENMHIRDPTGAVVFHGKRNKRGLYVCPLNPAQAHAFPATVKEEEEFDFKTMKPGMSEGEFYRFVHGHYTQEERKRATEAWVLHGTMGHMGRKALGDALENGLYAGCNLTRRDVDNAYKLFGGCNACLEGKYQLPSEPPSETEPCPSVGHTLNVDLYIYRVTTLGGYNYVVIATDQKSGAILHAPIKKKTAECVLEGIMRIVGSLNKFQHKVHKIVFDSEAVFLAMEPRVAVKGISCGYTPAGLHNKPVERAMQTLKAKMRSMKADLDYELPKHLYGELMSAAVTAINSTPNTRSGPNATPFQLITLKRPRIKEFKFGQVGMCESRRINEPDDVAEWAMYLGTSSNVEGHFRVYISARGTVYSRRSFKIPPRSSVPGATASAPKEWGFSPRLKAKDKTQTGEKEDEKAELEAEEVLRKMMKDVSVDVQEGKKSMMEAAGNSLLGMENMQGEASRSANAHEGEAAHEQRSSDATLKVPEADRLRKLLQDDIAAEGVRHPVASEGVRHPVASEGVKPSVEPKVTTGETKKLASDLGDYWKASGGRRAAKQAQVWDERLYGKYTRLKLAYHASLVGHVDTMMTPFSLYCYRYSVKQGLADPDVKRREAVMESIEE
jgi:hypothetical protein